jgi:hypothetical protein
MTLNLSNQKPKPLYKSILDDVKFQVDFFPALFQPEKQAYPGSTLIFGRKRGYSLGFFV